MTNEVSQLVVRALEDGTQIIVLVMPREGPPIVATSMVASPEVVAATLRGWAGLLENSCHSQMPISEVAHA